MTNILMVRYKSNQLGDTICTLPMYLALKKKFPKSKISLLRGPTNYEIPYKELNPFLDDVIIYDRNASFKEKKALVKILKSRKFDYAIIPSSIRKPSTTEHIINYLSGAKKRVGLSSLDGIKNPFAFTLNIKKKFDWTKRNISQIMRGIEIIEQIGCSITQEEIDSITISLDKENFDFADKFIENNFDRGRILIGIHPGGKIPNRWDVKNFAVVIEKVSKEKNAEFLITSGEIDKEVTAELSKILTEKKIKFAVAQSLSIKDLSAVMRKFNLYICNDTGILHLASLNHVKTIGLFGPTSCNEWNPIGKNTKCIQSPTENINDLKVEIVFEEANKILNKSL